MTKELRRRLMDKAEKPYLKGRRKREDKRDRGNFFKKERRKPNPMMTLKGKEKPLKGRGWEGSRAYAKIAEIAGFFWGGGQLRIAESFQSPKF